MANKEKLKKRRKTHKRNKRYRKKRKTKRKKSRKKRKKSRKKRKNRIKSGAGGCLSRSIASCSDGVSGIQTRLIPALIANAPVCQINVGCNFVCFKIGDEWLLAGTKAGAAAAVWLTRQGELGWAPDDGKWLQKYLNTTNKWNKIIKDVRSAEENTR
jgi:hypothetical protein